MPLSLGPSGQIHGYRPRRRNLSQTLMAVAALVALFGGLVLGIWMILDDREPAPPVEPDPALEPQPDPEQMAQEAPAPVPEATPPAGVRTLTGAIAANLYNSFVVLFDAEDPKEQLLAQQVAAHFKRLFFFDVNFDRDPRPGDRFAVIWEQTDETSDGVRILAATYESKLHRKVFDAYYFHDSADEFARHYTAEGVETQRRLKDSPIANFEQVTSLLHDRRPRHLGVDFKAPVGTPVTLPFDARVDTAGYQIHRFNGRWLKLIYERDGMEAIFLHLDSVEPGLSPGKRLKAGAALGTVGNTGRSFGPHLHYQLQRGKQKVLDPYKVHGSYQRTVSAASKAEFLRQVAIYQEQHPALRNLELAPDETATR